MKFSNLLTPFQTHIALLALLPSLGITAFAGPLHQATEVQPPAHHAAPGHGHGHSDGLDLSRPDAHAPISIMGDHVHHAGEFMLSYRYMYMDMDGMRSGDSGVSANDVFDAGYIITPLNMSMHMHMLGGMYAPTDWLTLMVMGNYQSAEMDHQIFSGAAPLIALNGGSDTFTTSVEGFGDTTVTALFRLYECKVRSLHGGLGLSMPTGSIDESDIVPGPGGRIERRLPASMQLGSGTWDLIPSLTYLRQFPDFSYGLQAKGILRTGENDNGYRHGHEFHLTGWGQWRATRWLSLGTGAAYEYQGELSGRQEQILRNPPFAPSRRTVPTAFSENYGGNRIDAILAANFYVPEGFLKGHRLGVDLRLPVYRDLNGYQLETDAVLTIGWQKAW